MKLFLKALAALALLYVLGFAVFLAALPAPRAAVPQVGGLAVFTGGSNRVAMAIEALEQGYSGPVLISGVNPDVKLNDLAPDLAADVQAQIELDRKALTTRENVDNTAAWAAENDLKDVGVITSTYHALRVRLLFAWRAPQLQVVIVPVQPNEAGLGALWREYHKLLAVPFLR
ncbi:MAG TPA: YdcF family protein [Alphaproteobacteria bacterium]|nr:YdcF family protein [Alphaproteobacteria bacterium]